MGGRIVLLDDVTASRIAAGEVVERPASAVKELVENAIDAGASHITVILEEGGKRRIEVSDDGCGMDAEDAILAVQRHATSKIRSADDLERVKTLGFRGEALPSIASVSHFTLITKAKNSPVATELTIHGGVLEKLTDRTGRDGTTVIVEDLFYNTPARLKFLKTTATELTRCVESVSMLAAAHPSIVVRVVHNGQELLSTPGTGDLVGVLANIWGRAVARKLVSISEEEPHLRVDGYVGTPEASRPGRTHQLFVVSGRPVRSRVLAHAVEQAFRDITPEARYPICCIHMQMDPEQVDVNVHPAKLEVKFRNESEVHAILGRAVRRALVRHGLLPEVRSAGLTPGGAWQVPRRDSGSTVQAVTTSLAAFGRTPASATAESLFDDDRLALGGAEQTGDAAVLADMLRDFRVLGQANNTYIVAATEQGLVLVDQHVAHERVLYERLLTKQTEHGVSSQRLAVPLTVSFGAAEFALVSRRLDDFRAAGWELEPFGGRALVVRAVPSLLRQGQQEAVLRDMVDELVHQTVARRLVVDRDQVTIAHACRMAVKAGDALSVEEMTGLLRQLAETRNPHFCPHGRPAAVLVPYSEIDRRFKR